MKDKYCKRCEVKGFRSKLKFQYCNFEEGIFVCEDDMCMYPFGEEDIHSFFIKAHRSETEHTSTTQLPSNIQTSQFYWSNSDNLCWLDSVMTILVNNRCLELCLKKQQGNNSILQQLFSKFVKAQSLGPKQQGNDVLCEVRRDVFDFLKGKMQCSRGMNDSALVSLNVLLKDCSVISEKFNQECEWTFKCSLCGYTQVNRYNKLVVTFPNTTDDFSMPCGEFVRACHNCTSPGQRSQLHLKRLPPCVMAHFGEGVKSKNFFKSGFLCHGKEYELCQLIQYKRDPDHFIAWIRNRNGTHWAKIDDTQSVVCKWREGYPSFPPHQVHIAVWERAKLYRSRSSVCKIDAKTSGKSQTMLEISKNMEALSGNVNGAESCLVSCKEDRLSELSCRSQVASIYHKEFSENVIDGQRKSVPVSDSASLSSVHSNPFQSHEQKKEKNDDEVNGESNLFRRSFNKGNSVGVGEEKAGVDCSNRKRKDSFHPYVPKRKRISPCSDSFERNREARFCDNPIDSGYSSPSSNGSVTSLPSTLESKEANVVLSDILETLDDIEGGVKQTTVELKSDHTVVEKKIGGSNRSLNESGVGESGSDLGFCDTFAGFQKSILCCGQNMTKDTTLISDLKMPACISHVSIGFCEDFSVEGRPPVKDETQNKSLDFSCDFVDIETVSNCGNNFLDDIEASLDLTEVRVNDVADFPSGIDNQTKHYDFSQYDDRLRKSRWNEDHCLFDILEEIFPNNLLDKETCKLNLN